MAASTPRQRRGRGRVITFYSYKGGTGRTMALANVAWVLAGNGYRVLAVDWDLESPGLHRFFHPLLDDPQLHASDGVIDLIRDFASAAVHEPHQPGTALLQVRPDVRQYAVSLNWRFANGGELDLLPAGRQGPAYSATVSTFDWPSFYDRLGGATFLTELRQNMREHYDFVLIDSRTGLSDSAGICTVLLPDTVLNCFTLSTQSIDGAVAVARSIRNQRMDDPVLILPVPMRVEEGEQSKLDAGRDYAWLRFAPYLDHLGAEATAQYWADVEVPYKLFYAYEEILAVFGDRPRQAATLLAAYERLARAISRDNLPELEPLDEPVRRYWLAKFERTRPRAMTQVLISYAAEDRMWAEWIAGVANEVGLPTLLREVSTLDNTEAAGPAPGTDADLVAILFSTSYRLPADLASWLAPAVTPAPGRPRSSVLPISVDGTPPPDELDRFGVLELSGMPADRARAALLAALNRPAGEPAAAGAHIAAPPRFPATPPRVSQLPLRNPNFTGRRQLLGSIRDHLSSPSGAAAPLALTGLGGVGKTQVAIEYAHRYAADYDVVWWVSAAQGSMTRAGLVDLADELGVPATDTTAQRVRLLLDTLNNGRPYRRWLLVFDNAGDPKDLRDVLPAGPGHVLLTSRSPAWGRDGQLIEVQPFGREESIELLRLRLPALAIEDADQVADRLGDLPLAIEQAGSWLAATGMPVDRYLALVDNQPSRLLAENPPPGYEQAGAVTWLLSLEQLRKETPAAGGLVELLAFFGPEPIPAPLLYSRKLIEIVADDDAALRDDANFGRLIAQARRYALASFDEAQGSMQMHRLVMAVIRESLPSEAAARCRRQVHEILVAASPGDSERPETWPGFASVWPHVVPSGALRSTDDDVRQLVLDVTRYLFRRGDFAGSAELAESTLRAWSAHWPQDDLKLLAVKIFLANALRPRGDYTRARELDEEAYERLLDSVGRRNQYTLMCMNGLAADLWVIGDFDRARDLNREALAHSVELFGREHRRTFRAMNNLAVFMEQVGEYREADRLHEEAYNGRRRTLGERFPETLFSATSYGRALRLAGDLRGSRRLLDSALAGHGMVHGEDHPATLRTGVELAATLRRLGELDAAQTLTRTIFAKLEVTQPAGGADRLACANTLALILSTLGNHLEALELGRESADGHQEAFGANHLHTLAVTGNLAVLLRRAGEVDHARQLADEVVERLARAVGANHPYTLQCSIIAANTRFAGGEHAAALEIERRVYEQMAPALGETHPERLVAGGNLAASRRAVGDVAGLEEFLTELVAQASRVLGRDHPITSAIVAGDRWECELDLSQY